MFDIGWSELLIIGVVALIVVGPKDLPKMFRTLGQLTGKARAMAREFQRAMESAADEAGVGDVRRAAQDFRGTMSGRNLKSTLGLDDLDREMNDIDREMRNLQSGARKPGAPNSPAPASPAGPPPAGEDGDDIIAAEHDAALEARNAALSATEAERLKRQAAREEARLKAAELRARTEANSGANPAAQPPAPSAPPAREQ